ncbi:GNAT family N-acetyltransferase [Streptacidiphilus jiangxiensis]|uniref:Acetyltransferase (GNAT) family protein n=1 Tax=Streptacidiphilus jiangxiensis TaxID=235985 RepID=A0A1H7ZLF7_STRJI|nr:GNAT family N-acetyltransferase [Streptacidiphilus jiangxiensis]SEM59166.1 Acetyltransferase (GNAT) family protein [Streptacidiphilus jiangxiensis]
MSIKVRVAAQGDVPALVRLRLANAERHVQLDRELYRVPDAEVVRQHFEETLRSTEPKAVILVAEVTGDGAGEVVGMLELAPLAEPPDHQILVPRRAADVHTVVLEGRRGEGVGSALLQAAEQAASELGISTLYAGIFTPNQAAVRFYSSVGFGPRGTVLSKPQAAPAAAR